MKYIIDLKGLAQANILVGGSVIEVQDGQEVSEVVYKAAPKFVRVEGSKVESIVETKEKKKAKKVEKKEILTEVSEPVDIIIEDQDEQEESK